MFIQLKKSQTYQIILSYILTSGKNVLFAKIAASTSRFARLQLANVYSPNQKRQNEITQIKSRIVASHDKLRFLIFNLPLYYGVLFSEFESILLYLELSEVFTRDGNYFIICDHVSILLCKHSGTLTFNLICTCRNS